MRISTCPTAMVHAPRDVIWHLLTDPDTYELWSGARLVAVTPAGYAQKGQRIQMRVRRFAREFRVAFDMLDVDEPSGRMRFDVHLPFGIVNHETIKVSALGEAGTFVSFN